MASKLNLQTTMGPAASAGLQESPSFFTGLALPPRGPPRGRLPRQPRVSASASPSSFSSKQAQVRTQTFISSPSFLPPPTSQSRHRWGHASLGWRGASLPAPLPLSLSPLRAPHSSPSLPSLAPPNPISPFLLPLSLAPPSPLPFSLSALCAPDTVSPPPLALHAGPAAPQPHGPPRDAAHSQRTVREAAEDLREAVGNTSPRHPRHCGRRHRSEGKLIFSSLHLSTSQLCHLPLPPALFPLAHTATATASTREWPSLSEKAELFWGKKRA